MKKFDVFLVAVLMVLCAMSSAGPAFAVTHVKSEGSVVGAGVSVDFYGATVSRSGSDVVVDVGTITDDMALSGDLSVAGDTTLTGTTRQVGDVNWTDTTIVGTNVNWTDIELVGHNVSVNWTELELSGSTVNWTDAIPVSAGNVNWSQASMIDVDINGGSVDGTTVGAASASSGAFTTVSASGEIEADAGIYVDGSLYVGTVVLGSKAALSGVEFLGVATSDPCGTVGTYAIFFNGTTGSPCFCNKLGVDLSLYNGTSACF